MATKTNIRTARKFIRNGEAFTAGGNAYGMSNFRGDSADINYGTGRLNKDEADKFLAARFSGAMRYVVWSYGTPIAWLSEGGWYQVDQKFSPSTSRHQSAVSLALTGF